MTDGGPEAAGEGSLSIVGEAGDTIGDILTGVPAPVRKGLWKAAGRLVQGLVDVPANVLEAKARDIKHQQAMREKVRAALTKSAIGRLPEHLGLADRALEHHVADILGKQENRESVLRAAARELSGPSSDGNGESTINAGDLDDDWLNGFASHAERASTERMRQLFGRVLAGEIRKRNSFSLFTLDLLSKLSQREADWIVQIAPFVFRDAFVATPRSKEVLTFTLRSRLGELGILSAPSIGVDYATRTWKLASDSPITGKPGGVFIRGETHFIVTAEEPTSVTFEFALLTTAGEQILALHDAELDPQMLREWATYLKGQGVTLSAAPVLSPRQDGSVNYGPLVDLAPIERSPQLPPLDTPER